MAGRVKSRFPRSLDKPMLVLMWELDEFVLFVIPSIISLFFKELVVGIVAGFILMKLYAKYKEGKPNNYLFHLFWKVGLMHVKGTPPSHIRKFLE